MATEPTIAKLRHLYQNMVNGAVRDTASAKRIAEGLLAPAIEALERGAQPAPADSVLEDAAWMPLTPELLTAIESGDHGERFWLATHNNSEPQIGVYEWRQGRNPHGFRSDLGRYGASEITHVMPYKPPALPAARKQGANHD